MICSNLAVAAFGGSRASNAIEVLGLCLPIWIELKRQQKADERERMRQALEIALSKYHRKSPRSGEQDQDQEAVISRQKRSDSLKLACAHDSENRRRLA